MKKFVGYLILSLFWVNPILADINLSCVMTGWNQNDDYDKDPYNIEYKELAPSHFSAIIEITSPGKVIGRLIGTSETGNMNSPYVGTIDDNKIVMNHKFTKLDQRGVDFTLDLISGRFEQESFILDYKYWWLQKTGKCKLVD